MQKTTHTPGPWNVRRGKHSVYCDHQPTTPQESYEVVFCSSDIRAADAALIAAAPMLLDAARAILDEGYTTAHRRALRAAVAQAEGDTDQ